MIRRRGCAVPNKSAPKPMRSNRLYETGLCSRLFQAVNCQATIVPSLRDKGNFSLRLTRVRSRGMVRGPRKDQRERFGYIDNSDPFAAREDPSSPAAFENESFSRGYVGSRGRGTRPLKSGADSTTAAHWCPDPRTATAFRTLFHRHYKFRACPGWYTGSASSAHCLIVQHSTEHRWPDHCL